MKFELNSDELINKSTKQTYIIGMPTENVAKGPNEIDTVNNSKVKRKEADQRSYSREKWNSSFDSFFFNRKYIEERKKKRNKEGYIKNNIEEINFDTIMNDHFFDFFFFKRKNFLNVRKKKNDKLASYIRSLKIGKVPPSLLRDRKDEDNYYKFYNSLVKEEDTMEKLISEKSIMKTEYPYSETVLDQPTTRLDRDLSSVRCVKVLRNYGESIKRSKGKKKTFDYRFRLRARSSNTYLGAPYLKKITKRNWFEKFLIHNCFYKTYYKPFPTPYRLTRIRKSTHKDEIIWHKYKLKFKGYRNKVLGRGYIALFDRINKEIDQEHRCAGLTQRALFERFLNPYYIQSILQQEPQYNTLNYVEKKYHSHSPLKLYLDQHSSLVELKMFSKLADIYNSYKRDDLPFNLSEEELQEFSEYVSSYELVDDIVNSTPEMNWSRSSLQNYIDNGALNSQIINAQKINEYINSNYLADIDTYFNKHLTIEKQRFYYNDRLDDNYLDYGGRAHMHKKAEVLIDYLEYKASDMSNRKVLLGDVDDETQPLYIAYFEKQLEVVNTINVYVQSDILFYLVPSCVFFALICLGAFHFEPITYEKYNPAAIHWRAQPHFEPHHKGIFFDFQERAALLTQKYRAKRKSISRIFFFSMVSFIIYVFFF